MKVLSFDVGSKNLALCKLDICSNTKSFMIEDWQVLCVVDASINVNKTNIEDLAPPFAKTVEENISSWLVDVDKMFIESQPMGRTRNLKTKILSHILQVIALRHKPELSIGFIHPSLKLKEMTGPREYRLNKKYAITKTEELLGSDFCNNKEMACSLFVGKKRDDMADAFLQGFYAIDAVAFKSKATTTESSKPRKYKKRKTAVLEINE
jgi:hypothetical protein